MVRTDDRVESDATGFWSIMARSALQSADLMSGGIASHFAEGGEHRGLGLHDADAYARVERAMTRVRTDAAREFAEGADKAAQSQSQRLQPMGVADSFYMASIDRAGPPRTAPNALQVAAASDAPRFAKMRVHEIVGSSREGAREVARRTVREAIAAIRDARRQLDGIGKFVDGAHIRAVGEGAPEAFARAGRRMVMLGLVAGVSATMVPHEAQAWGMRGNGSQPQGQPAQVQAQFPRPVMVRPMAAPIVVQGVQAPVVTNNGGWNGNGWNGNGNGYGNGYGWNGGSGRTAAAVAAGVVVGAAIAGGTVNGYGAPYGGGYPNGAYGNGGYGVSHVAAAPPSDRIVMAARLVTMEMTGSVRLADRRVNDLVAQGAACVRSGAGGCVINAPGIHFDYRAGVYGVSRAGRDVAVQNANGYHEVDRAFLARAFDDAVTIKRQEDAGVAPGGYGRSLGQAAGEGRGNQGGDPQQYHHARGLEGHAATEGYWDQGADGDWEQHVPAPGR